MNMGNAKMTYIVKRWEYTRRMFLITRKSKNYY